MDSSCTYVQRRPHLLEVALQHLDEVEQEREHHDRVVILLRDGQEDQVHVPVEEEQVVLLVKNYRSGLRHPYFIVKSSYSIIFLLKTSWMFAATSVLNAREISTRPFLSRMYIAEIPHIQKFITQDSTQPFNSIPSRVMGLFRTVNSSTRSFRKIHNSS